MRCSRKGKRKHIALEVMQTCCGSVLKCVFVDWKVIIVNERSCKSEVADENKHITLEVMQKRSVGVAK